MVNLEVMFLTRTECSLNNSKAKSSRNFVVDPTAILIVVVQQYLSILELITRKIKIKIMTVKIQKMTIIL